MPEEQRYLDGITNFWLEQKKVHFVEKKKTSETWTALLRPQF